MKEGGFYFISTAIKKGRNNPLKIQGALDLLGTWSRVPSRNLHPPLKH